MKSEHVTLALKYLLSNGPYVYPGNRLFQVCGGFLSLLLKKFFFYSMFLIFMVRGLFLNICLNSSKILVLESPKGF